MLLFTLLNNFKLFYKYCIMVIIHKNKNLIPKVIGSNLKLRFIYLVK